MKRILLTIAIAVSLAPPVVFGQRGQLANAGKVGLNVTSLEEVLRLPEDQIDLATATLISSEYWSDFVQGRHYLERLDTMAMVIRTRLRQQRLPMDHRAIPVDQPVPLRGAWASSRSRTPTIRTICSCTPSWIGGRATA